MALTKLKKNLLDRNNNGVTNENIAGYELLYRSRSRISITKKIIITFLIFGLLSIFNRAYSQNIIINFSNNIDEEIHLQISKDINLEKNLVLLDTFFISRNNITLNLSNVSNEFITIFLANTSISLKVSSKMPNELSFDFNQKYWKIINSYYYKDIEFSKIIADLNQYENKTGTDSSSFVSYHIAFMERMNLKPFENSYNQDEYFNLHRRLMYFRFLNTLSGRKLLKIPISKNENILNLSKSWLNLENIDINTGSRVDFMALRQFLVVNFPRFYNPKNKESLSNIFIKVTDWVNNFDLKRETKVFLIGDAMMLSSKTKPTIDSLSISLISEFINKNPDSRHLTFLLDLLNKQDLKNEIIQFPAVNSDGKKLILDSLKEDYFMSIFGQVGVHHVWSKKNN